MPQKAAVPAMLLGSSFGMACFKWLNERQFAFAVNLLRIASGLSFLLSRGAQQGGYGGGAGGYFACGHAPMGEALRQKTTCAGRGFRMLSVFR